MDGSTGGNARDEAFVAGEFATRLHGLFCGYLHDAVNHSGVVVLGDEVGANALYAMGGGCTSA